MKKSYSAALRTIFTLVIVVSGLVYGQTINGKILDVESGETMIGASVVIEGTQNGAMTDIDGKFSINYTGTYPVNIVISFIGYKQLVYEVKSASDKIVIKMELDQVSLGPVDIIDDRMTERQKQEPLTVESFDVIAIKEAPSGSFYESLGTLKGVDMTSASLGFKVINTRGFNSTSPVRSLQLIDGVDNQSPGLNFSLGNFLGTSDLDVKKVDIVAGASSAFYGPGAFNGVIAMETKDPFLFPGLAASLKVGERNMTEFAVRWAQVIKNEAGEEKFGYKINAFYFSALDWAAENYDPVDNSSVPEDNPGRFDAVNVYGDEGTTASNNNYSLSSLQKFQNPGLGHFYRTGYQEVDLADYNTENAKFNAALHYKIKPDVQLIYNFNYSFGTTIYQGDNRYSLKNIQFMQNRIEARKDDTWFVRAYATHEDAGDSYDIVTTALRMQEEAISEQDWNTLYTRRWNTVYKRKIQQMDGYPQFIPGQMTLDEWATELYDPFIATVQDSLISWHSENANSIDTDPDKDLPKFQPGTPEFDSLFSDVRGRKFTEGGSLFYDRSALYHAHGEYKFKPEWGTITVGGNGRLYRPNSQGTIFRDTISYVYEETPDGPIAIDSFYNTITNFEFGVYGGVEKKLVDDKLKLNATLRLDKNQNFDLLPSYALSAVYSFDKNHTVRATFSAAIRNPTLADQYLYYDVGRARLLGNLNGYDSLVTVESTLDYLNSFNPDTLEYFDVDPIRPERVKTIEVGYRGMFKDKLYVDVSAYNSWYTDFIGYVLGVDLAFDVFGFFTADVYRIAANAEEVVTTRGVNIGTNYYFANKWAFNGNYSWNKLTSGEDDPIIPAFNTPEHKFNLGVTARDLSIKPLRLRHVGFGVNYKYIQGFLFEGSPQFTGRIDSYDLVDAQVSVEVPKIHTTFKLGASNLLNNQVYQVYGGPRVGRLAYFQVTYDFRNLK